MTEFSHTLALSSPETTKIMRIHYCADKEEMLHRAKAISKKGGCYFSGFVLPDGCRWFEIHRDGKVWRNILQKDDLRVVFLFLNEIYLFLRHICGQYHIHDEHEDYY